MRTPHGSRGGSTPPRLPATGKPQQWFVPRPWVFDVALAAVLLRAAPAPDDPGRSPGTRLRAGPRPRQRAARGLPVGPGPDFSPEYAMTTDPGEPVILTTLADPAGDPAGPLLIDGYARPVTVH